MVRVKPSAAVAASKCRAAPGRPACASPTRSWSTASSPSSRAFRPEGALLRPRTAKERRVGHARGRPPRRHVAAQIAFEVQVKGNAVAAVSGLAAPVMAAAADALEAAYGQPVAISGMLEPVAVAAADGHGGTEVGVGIVWRRPGGDRTGVGVIGFVTFIGGVTVLFRLWGRRASRRRPARCPSRPSWSSARRRGSSYAEVLAARAARCGGRVRPRVRDLSAHKRVSDEEAALPPAARRALRRWHVRLHRAHAVRLGPGPVLLDAQASVRAGSTSSPPAGRHRRRECAQRLPTSRRRRSSSGSS